MVITEEKVQKVTYKENGVSLTTESCNKHGANILEITVDNEKFHPLKKQYPLISQYDFALEFARRAHLKQTDKGGNDYILHPMTVANMVQGDKTQTVALLHDVLEDTDITASALEVLFGKEIADCVQILTRNTNESYDDYIKRCKTNPITRAVKIADLYHNMDMNRLTEITDADLKRLRKYEKALEYLTKD